jgi:glycosyltransferase involved in cell wall biosynthesis
MVFKNLWVFNPKTILESVAWLPFYSIFKKLNFINNKRIANQIKNASEELNFKNPVIFIDNEFFRAFYLKELLDHEIFIYYIRDYLIEQPYFKKHGASSEKEIIKKSDLVVTNSIYLQDYARDFNKNSYYIGQGCDLTLFDAKIRRSEPEDVQSIPHPRIGYVGALTTTRLDISILEYLVEQNPSYSFVFIGPEDSVFKKSLLHELDNTYFLGTKPKEMLADYIAYLDICLNPQIRNKQTEGNYPLKIDEYLAMGKPVIATYTTTMEMFSKYVYLAHDKEEYNNYLTEILSGRVHGKNEERIAFAQMHTWENCIISLTGHIQSTLALNK